MSRPLNTYSDPNCKVKWPTDPLNADVDGRNLRAFEQTRRFGYSFLWGRQRYVDAFTKTSVLGSDNRFAANPIFAGGLRDPSLVVVAAIVGVPNQLLIDPETGQAKALTDADWENIAGPIGKRDPHMIESIAPRAGVTRFLRNRWVDPVHGGDRDVPDGDDLQYACIAERARDENGCWPDGHDCDGDDAHLTNPLCVPAQPKSCTKPTSGPAQRYFKAYPGLRHLRIVKDLGASGFVASICAKSYRPALDGITQKIRATLGARCERASLDTDPQGRVGCVLFESMREGTDGGKRCEDLARGLCTPGAAPCRREGTSHPPISPEAAAAQLNLPITVVGADGVARPTPTQAVAQHGSVYLIGADHAPDGSPAPRKHLVCELQQLDGEALQSCAEAKDFTLDPAVAGGWCYSTNPEIVGEQCRKLGAPGTIRYLGAVEPRDGSEPFAFCGQWPGGTC
ncbi:MAG: hypothetical protein HYV09_31305 [Deltaproteobacteria bacterium]|nr:hypothetical protein [Deltaproteobacteria bacterium]